jgi:YfiH family protein
MLRLRAKALSAAPAIAHGYFGRTGGVSRGLYASLNCGGPDRRDDIVENRRRVGDALAPGAALVTLAQVHGTRAIVVDKPWGFGEAPECDAAVTAKRGVALGILTADCAPVLLADAEAKVVGAAHAGWKGALSGVIENAVSAMESLGARRTRIAAAIGPCISQPNYEVGSEFHAAFLAQSAGNATFFAPGTRAGHFHFDLDSYVHDRLSAAGIGAVERISACTYARESEFFSFRRATHRGEQDHGRQISAILLCK